MNKITKEQLLAKIKEEYPYWAQPAQEEYADKIIKNLDTRLTDVLNAYVSDNQEMDFQNGEFSIQAIRKLRKCRQFEAIMLMDKYLKDPIFGRSYILRRK